MKIDIAAAVQYIHLRFVSTAVFHIFDDHEVIDFTLLDRAQ